MGALAAIHADTILHPATASWQAAATASAAASPAPDRFVSCLLDALSVCAVVVDGAGSVRLASVAGTEALRRPGSGISILPARPGTAGGPVLTARSREDAAILRRLIAAAAAGGTGGSLRLRPGHDDSDDGSMQVVVVTPLPGGFGAGAGLVLVKIEDLVHRAAPSATLLSQLFGFTRSEALVARGLVGGASAEDVAHSRAVSIDTVRGQIRSILRKSETANLRSFERLMATLATLGTESAPTLSRPAAVA